MNEALQPGFIRQRRNLMIISLVLLFAETSKLTLQKLNVLGNELLIDNPTTVNLALWIAFAYWLWRYYAYFNDVGEKGFWMTQRQRMTDLVGRIALNRIRADQQFTESLREVGKTNLKINSTIEWYERSLLRFDLKFTVAAHTSRFYDDPRPAVFPFDHYIVDNKRALLIAHISAWVHVLTRTHHFSEYLLPFAVAALPVIYKGYAMVLKMRGML